MTLSERNAMKQEIDKAYKNGFADGMKRKAEELSATIEKFRYLKGN